MRGILIGMQQADDNAFNVERDQFLCSAEGTFLAQRDNHGARHIHTLHHAARELARHERRIVTMRVEVDTILIGIAQIALDCPAHALPANAVILYDDASDPATGDALSRRVRDIGPLDSL